MAIRWISYSIAVCVSYFINNSMALEWMIYISILSSAIKEIKMKIDENMRSRLQRLTGPVRIRNVFVLTCHRKRSSVFVTLTLECQKVSLEAKLAAIPSFFHKFIYVCIMELV